MNDRKKNLARLLSTAGVQNLKQLPSIPRAAIENVAALDPVIVDGLCLALSRQRSVLLRAVTEASRGKQGRRRLQVAIESARDGGVTMDEIKAARARGVIYAARDRHETWDEAERVAGMRDDQIDHGR